MPDAVFFLFFFKSNFMPKKKKKNMNGLENKEATFSCSVIHNGSPQRAFPHI